MALLSEILKLNPSGSSAAITTYSNATNNYVLTAVNSNTVQGESNLQFDGSILTVTGNVQATQLSGSFSGSFSGDGSGLTGVSSTVPAGTVSGSIQVDHDATANFVANEHIDHSGVSITAGLGLSGGGSITATRTLTLDTGSAHYTQSIKNLVTHSKSITVESPTATEDISMFFVENAMTITKMVAVNRGTTPSVTWTVRHGTDRSAAGAQVVTGGTATTSTTTGSVVTAFNDATVVANSFVWLETTAVTGTVDEFNLTVFYTND